MEGEEVEVSEKYWIKPGICVYHVDMEGLKLRVIKVNKTQNKEGRWFTKGVLCSWFDGNAAPHEAEFHTTLLRPCND